MAELKLLVQWCVVAIAILICSSYIANITHLHYQPYGDPARVYRLYTRTNGRLGNHLFNLATAYGLSRTNHRKFVLEPKFVDGIKSLLDVAHLKFEIAKAPEWVKQRILVPAVYKPEMEHLEEEDLIIGRYIQVRQYFQSYMSEMRTFFIINENLVRSTQEFLHGLRSSPASTFVGIHVRRGDFLSKNSIQYGRRTPKPRYLQKAMVYFLSKYNNVEFIVCSDDIEWCKHEIILQGGNVSSLGDYGVRFSIAPSSEWDLALLAQCNHTITTVGTFGWWGAWFAGGEAIYFNHSVTEGSDMAKIIHVEDYFLPAWIGMDDE